MTFVLRQIRADRRTVLAKVGRCIYCGRADVRLREEHAVPAGLNGRWVLLRASCDDCADNTSATETHVLGEAFLPARVLLGVGNKRRKKKKRQDRRFPLDVLVDGKPTTVQVKAEERPMFLALPVFAMPAHLTGQAHEEGKMTALRCDVRHVGGATEAELDARWGPGCWHFRLEYDLFSVPRMVAKIAYCMAVGDYGYDAFVERYVVPGILGQREDLGRWVGSTSQLPFNDVEGVDAVGLALHGDDLLAYVRLFMQFGGPEYVVVVGRLKAEIAERERALMDAAEAQGLGASTPQSA